MSGSLKGFEQFTVGPNSPCPRGAPVVPHDSNQIGECRAFTASGYGTVMLRYGNNPDWTVPYNVNGTLFLPFAPTQVMATGTSAGITCARHW